MVETSSERLCRDQGLVNSPSFMWQWRLYLAGHWPCSGQHSEILSSMKDYYWIFDSQLPLFPQSLQDSCSRAEERWTYKTWRPLSYGLQIDFAGSNHPHSNTAETLHPFHSSHAPIWTHYCQRLFAADCTYSKSSWTMMAGKKNGAALPKNPRGYQNTPGAKHG